MPLRIFFSEFHMKHAANEIYKVSRWGHLFTQGDVIAVLHALSLEVLFLERATGELLQEQERATLELWTEMLGVEACDALVQAGILVPHSKEEMQDLVDLREQLLSEQKLDLMYLLLTDGCNLKCTYCFEDTPESRNFCATMMDVDTAIEALRFFGRMTKLHGTHGAEKIVQLYGGEPLMNKKAVLAVVRAMSDMRNSGELPQDTQLVVVTNGVLLDDELIDLFADNNIGVGISLDGPPNINNKYRIAKREDVDVFRSAMEAYQKAKQRGVAVGLSITLTPEAVDNFDAVLDFFVDDVGIENGVGFNLLHFNPAVSGSGKYFDKAATCLIKAFERFRELGIYEERMMRKVSAFVKQEPMYADCGVIGNQVVISPDGRVGVCQDFVKPRKYFDGSVHDQDYDPIEAGLFEDWRKRSPMFMEDCIGCEAVAMCGGGCPASIELQSGSRWNVDKRVCPHSKKSLEWLVWQTFALENG